MGISEMVQQSDPADAARAAYAAARAIVDAGTAPAELIAQAEQLIAIGEDKLAAGLRGPQQQPESDAAAPGGAVEEPITATAEETALGIDFNGSDLIVTVPEHEFDPHNLEVSADGSVLLVTDAGRHGAGTVRRAVDLTQPINVEDLTMTFLDGGGLEVRVPNYLDHTRRAGGGRARPGTIINPDQIRIVRGVGRLDLNDDQDPPTASTH